MKNFWLTAQTDILESLRAKWFLVYSFIFGGLVALLFVFGLTESRVMGFTGLSRLMVTYIQLAMAILPVFVLITTVRSAPGDRAPGSQLRAVETRRSRSDRAGRRIRIAALRHRRERGPASSP